MRGQWSFLLWSKGSQEKDQGTGSGAGANVFPSPRSPVYNYACSPCPCLFLLHSGLSFCPVDLLSALPAEVEVGVLEPCTVMLPPPCGVPMVPADLTL